jgi:tubulin-folding cofactor B
LRDYQVRNGFEIRIVDTDVHSLSKSGWLEDTSLVEKYVMPDEVYEARDGTVRKFKQQQQQLKEKERGQPVPIVLDENMSIGRRCEVFPGGRRGEIRFVGAAPALGEGAWVGVALDEPLGKNDGSVKGKKYFICNANHGVMVRPDNVTVGDFPIRTLSDVESEDEM